MDDTTRRTATPLIRVVALLQIKLLLSAGRDLVLAPVALAAAALDLVSLKKQEPQYFRAVLRFGQQTDEWIDTWSHGRGDAAPPRGSVDALLASVEDVVRDPQSGAHRARVLKRWAERQMSRARQQTATQLSTRSGPEHRG
ncbi:MAG: hypothetical protein ABIR62_10265 [Dokdonella sp.]